MGLFFTTWLNGQNSRFVFYNVENLFHPDQDSLNPDQEFSPEGSKEWTYYKYHERLRRLSKLIINLSDSNFEAPTLVAFAEIENKQVLEDLIQNQPLRKLDYQLIHYDSPDRRGIDVGLIYRKDQLRLLNSLAIPYFCDSIPDYHSRDMLYASFSNLAGDTLQFVICHWPSRYGGQEASQFKRLCASERLVNFTDSIKALSKAPFILMGDFNDSPVDSSLRQLSTLGHFDNLMKDLPKSLGSHRYKGEWSYLDQMLVSKNYRSHIKDFGVFQAPFLLEKESKYPGYRPKRAFRGTYFTDGFSDHLPIYLDWRP